MDDNKEKNLNKDTGSSDGINKDLNSEEIKKDEVSSLNAEPSDAEASQAAAFSEQTESKSEHQPNAQPEAPIEVQLDGSQSADEEASSDKTVNEEPPRRRVHNAEDKPQVSAGSKPHGKKTGNGKKKKKFGPVSIILLVLCAGVFCFAVFNIVQGIIADRSTAGEKDGLAREEEEYDMSEGPTEVGLPGRESPDEMSNEFIALEDVNLDNINYLKISNLENFKELNNDTTGWLYFPGPKEIQGMPIDISIVQTTDNAYYLTHSFSKKENINGWVFGDYENDMKNLSSNRNAVFYGHARSYNMFGGLKDLNSYPDWYNNANNHFVKITTETEETVWQIFSWYETNVRFNYIQDDFSSDKEYLDFLNLLQAKNSIRKSDGSSVFQTFEFDKDSKIITLSTCKGTNKDNRVAVHAKLVKSRAR